MALCRITGIVYLPSGEIAARREVTFVKEPDSVTADYLGAVLPEPIRTRTDNDGSIDLTLITGNYYGFILGRGGHNKYTFRSVVPEAATADFADLIAAVDPVEPLPSWLQQVIDARDEARASEVAAQAAALAANKAPASWADFQSSGFLDQVDGSVAQFNGVQFVRDRASDIPGLASGEGWKPLGYPQPEHFGAGLTADDTSAVRSWALSSGKIVARGMYSISGNIPVIASRVDAVGSTFSYSGATETRMIDLMTAGASWVGGELDGNLLASAGVYSVAGGCVVNGAVIHGMRSTTGQTAGVWLVGPSGGVATNNEIYDLSATGDGTPGDGNGPSRAVVMTSPTAMTAPCIIMNNIARDINGEEGDVFQILVFDGTFPFGSAAWSVIKGNRAKGFNRRGVKIQASQVICEDNILDATGATGGLGPMSVIDVIGSDEVIVRRNITSSVSGMKGVQFTKPAGGAPISVIAQGNIHNGVEDSDAITADGVAASVIEDNIQLRGRRALFVVNSERSAVRNNVSMRGDTVGSFTDFEISSTNTRMLVDGNISMTGTKYATLGAYSPLSSFTRTASLRDSGAVVATSAMAVSSVIDGTLAITSAGAPVAGLNEAMTLLTRTTQLGSASGAGSCNDAWVSAIPSTSRTGQYHVRGDVFWNSGAGPEAGWRCTATGTPGTWAAF